LPARETSPLRDDQVRLIVVTVERLNAAMRDPLHGALTKAPIAAIPASGITELFSPPPRCPLELPTDISTASQNT